MAAKGWKVVAHEDGPNKGSLEASVSPEQGDLYSKDATECGEQLGYTDRIELTDAELTAMHAKLVAAADCLRKNGYAVPPDVSLQTYLSSRGQDWGVYRQVPREEWFQAIETCPQPSL